MVPWCTSSVRLRTAWKPRNSLVRFSLCSVTSGKRARCVGTGSGSDLLPCQCRTTSVGQRPEHLVTGERTDDLGEIPLAFRFSGRFDLHERDAVHHATVGTEISVLGKHVTHRRLTHLG